LLAVNPNRNVSNSAPPDKDALECVLAGAILL
jgi:hypothetical protein